MTAKKLGRPSKFDHDPAILGPKIINMMIHKPCTVSAACKALGVSRGTFYYWTVSDSNLFDKFARAREVLGHIRFEEAQEIADEEVPMTEKGLDRAAVSDKQVRIAARQYASRYLAPRSYGERIRVEGEGKQDALSEALALLKVMADKLPT